MWVCFCRAVNDRAVREAVEAGARTDAEVAQACGAGDRCGGCLPAIARLLQETESAAA